MNYRTDAEFRSAAAAVGLYKDYLITVIREADTQDPTIVSRNPEWYATYAAFTAESILNLTDYEESWIPAIDRMLREHIHTIYKSEFHFEEFSQQFQGLLERLKAIEDIDRIGDALRTYREQNKNYPKELGKLGAREECDLIDPWGNPYRYIEVSSDKGYELRSFGADGRSGTEDDITN